MESDNMVLASLSQGVHSELLLQGYRGRKKNRATSVVVMTLDILDSLNALASYGTHL
jgi:hypothetical protein